MQPEYNVFDSKSRRQRRDKKCSSRAHPLKNSLLNESKAKSPKYRNMYESFHKTSMETTYANARQMMLAKEIAHPDCFLSTKYANYLEDFKV